MARELSSSAIANSALSDINRASPDFNASFDNPRFRNSLVAAKNKRNRPGDPHT